MDVELWSRSATELAELIRIGEVKSREVVEAHLGQIDEVNGALNAVHCHPRRAGPPPAADEADAAVAMGAAVGPLHGVPFTIKENLDLAGSATTQGIPARARTGLAGILERLDAVVGEPTSDQRSRAT